MDRQQCQTSVYFKRCINNKEKYEKVLAPCGNVCATLKGDFVAVMPFYSERHKFWYYATIAKLKPYYLGEGKGFWLMSSMFIDNSKNPLP